MLEIKNINAGYGNLHILFDITAKIEKGKITAIVGPNGSGKSTLLKTIMGMTTVYSGKIIYKNIDITSLATHKITKEGIIYLSQVGNVFDELTLKENFKMAGYLLSENEVEKRVEEVLKLFPDLQTKMQYKCKYLSGGQKQMAAIAMALLREPEIILFDEPVASLSPKISGEILNVLKNLNEEHGLTILIVEQNVKQVLTLADNALLLVSGELKYEGCSKDLLKHPKLGKKFLGL
jgi:branched-chain amino acid transport system ATP-binding protein